MARILMLAPVIALDSDRGGAIHQRELLSELKKKNRVAVIAQGGTADVRLDAMPQPLLTVMAFLKSVFHAKKFGIIHDRGYLLGGAGILAGAINNVPTLLQVDDNWIEGDRASGNRIWRMSIYPYITRQWIRFFVRRAGALAVVSDSLCQVAVRDWGANPKKVHVIGNGVNLSKFRPDTKGMRSELGIRKDAKVVTFTGEMAPWHGILEAVKAAELVLKRRDDCLFVFAGGARAHENYLRKVRAYADLCSLGKNLMFLGKIPHEKVPSLLAASDILIAPYLQPKNINFGFSPLKLFEYMAMKRPIITSNLPWIREILSDREACLLKDPRDSKDFSEKILQLLDDRGRATRLVRNARTLAVKTYSWEKVAAKLEKAYASVLA